MGLFWSDDNDSDMREENKVPPGWKETAWKMHLLEERQRKANEQYEREWIEDCMDERGW